MIEIKIPGREELKIQNVVFDYNGTLAVDGLMEDYVKENLINLNKLVEVHILTADTYGTVRRECSDLGIKVNTFPGEGAAAFKKNIVNSLGGQTLCIGNGFNDIEMFKVCSLSICIIGEEGCCGKLISYSDIVVNTIEAAFKLLFNEDRLKATLRS